MWSAVLKGKEWTSTFPRLSAQPSGEQRKLQIQLTGELVINANLSCASSGKGMKKRDHPYQHCWAHWALPELMCAAVPRDAALREIRIYRQALWLIFQCAEIQKGTLWIEKETCLSLGKGFVYLNVFLCICFVLSFKQGTACRNPQKSETSFSFNAIKLPENPWPSNCSTQSKNDLLWVLQAVPLIAREKPLTNGIPLVFLQGSLIQKVSERILLIYMSYHFHLFQARGLS